MSGQMARPFPREALWAAAALVALAIGGAAAVRLGLLPQVADPEAMRAAAGVEPIVTRDLHFRDRADGAVVVVDTDGRTVAVVEPMSEQGFVRGVMRGLARERRLKGVTADRPFRLQLWADNGLTLTDLATGRQIELGSFGAANRAAFAVMLPDGAGTRE